MKNRDRIRISGLDNAKKVLEGLRYANHLSGNRSVSDKGHTQLRPDLILISQDANYLLVELKPAKNRAAGSARAISLQCSDENAATIYQ